MNNERDHTSYPSSVVIKPGAFVEPGVILNEQVVIGANAVVLTKDETTGKLAPAIIKAGAVIGANSTILPGITIGEKALVKPGSVVTRSVPPLAIVEGNPAIIIGYHLTHSDSTKEYSKAHEFEHNGVINSKVSGVTFHRLKFVSDLRGNLAVGEFEREIPFKPNRYFLVFDVPTAETRGEHAHRQCEQFLICVRGSCSVVVDNGYVREEFTLDESSLGLYLPPMVWGIQYKYTPDAVLLVFASHYYDSADYIRDYNDFLSLAGATK